MKTGYVYILTNKSKSSLYIGVTSDLERRVLEHKSGFGSKYSSKYNTTYLLYYEVIQGMQNAIDREKQLKNWHRNWKLNLIKEENPELKDLADEWYTEKEINQYSLDQIELGRIPY